MESSRGLCPQGYKEYQQCAVLAVSVAESVVSAPTWPLTLSLQAKSPAEVSARKSTRDEKSRKKDDKSVEQVLRALNSLETTEEKLAAMCKKYTDIVDENRKMQ
ncbi:unnamed protein product, partial [Timema podura]|nr:unnamed protein product [Timema podura]